MRNVILPLTDEQSGSARAEIAIAARLTRTLGGRLTIVGKITDEPESRGMGGTTVAAAPALSSAESVLVERADIPWHVEGGRDVLETAYRRAKAEHGILVMPCRPEIVLALPPTATTLAVAGEALILWDGSTSAVHALASAIPLLREAGRVTLLEVDDGSLQRPASDALPFLADHGVHGHVQHDLAFGEKAGFALLDRISTIAPAYVVMGGFGHARWLEGLLGGVTRRLLADCPVPIFLKH
jgi:nucleotide-binding universal stress UspA family protein